MYMRHVRNKMGLRYLNLPFSEKHALLENKHAYVSAQKLNTQVSNQRYHRKDRSDVPSYCTPHDEVIVSPENVESSPQFFRS